LIWCGNEDTENIGIMELYVIPNVCSEYSEQKIQANGRPYRTIIHSTWSGSSIRFTFDLFIVQHPQPGPPILAEQGWQFCLRYLASINAANFGGHNIF